RFIMWLAALGSLLLSERTKPGGSKVTDTFLATLGPAFPMTRSYLPMPANGVSAKRAYIIGRDRILLSFLADSRLAFAIHAVYATMHTLSTLASVVTISRTNTSFL